MGKAQCTDEDYRLLLTFRDSLRRFLHWSGRRAEASGVTPAHHQLLLAIRGHRPPHPPTIGELADHLLVRHHSAVQLVDRAEAAGLVSRVRDDGDHRVVRVALTAHAEEVLRELSADHLEELRAMSELFRAFADGSMAFTDLPER